MRADADRAVWHPGRQYHDSERCRRGNLIDAPLSTFTLETERLIIRPFALDDLGAVHELLNLCFGEQPLEQRKFWLEWSIMNYTALAMLDQPPYGDRAVVLQATGALIGTVGLVPICAPFDRLNYFRQHTSDPAPQLSTQEIGLFWALHPTQRGQGYATEAAKALSEYAFFKLGAKRLVATTEKGNHSSIAVMRRLNMVVEQNPDSKPAWLQVVGILENPALRSHPRRYRQGRR